MNPRHPVYVISKGRWESRMTVKALEAISVPYHVVIEPQEFDEYAKVINESKILVLPFSNLGQGSIPARNWVWQHSVEQAAEWHWILDDNIRGFFRYNHNRLTPVATGTTFAVTELFVDRYANIAMSGMNYFMFVSRKEGNLPAYYHNTRVYSCILIRNDIADPDVEAPGCKPLDERWRGRYNEDTDLSLRCLKNGWCTVLMNAFICDKMTTMTMTGGNTEQLYQIEEDEKDGRLLMAESLVEQHPDVARVSWKWNRWQHHVDYSKFKHQLKLRPGVTLPELGTVDDHGMVFQRLNRDGSWETGSPEWRDEDIVKKGEQR